MQNKKTETIVVDKRPTIAEWPVRIWAMEEIPKVFEIEARKSMKGTFAQYHMVYSPIRRTAQDSFEYMFGYGKGEIFYLKNEKNRQIKISKMRNFSKIRTTGFQNGDIFLQGAFSFGTEFSNSYPVFQLFFQGCRINCSTP